MWGLRTVHLTLSHVRVLLPIISWTSPGYHMIVIRMCAISHSHIQSVQSWLEKFDEMMILERMWGCEMRRVRPEHVSYAS